MVRRLTTPRAAACAALTDCEAPLASRQGLIVPAPAPQGSGEAHGGEGEGNGGEASAAAAEEKAAAARVSGFLLVKEEDDEEGAAASRTLRARMDTQVRHLISVLVSVTPRTRPNTLCWYATTQTAYILTLEEDNLRLRERLLRVESELKAVQEAHHGGSRVCSTDASEGSMEEGERPPSQHRFEDYAGASLSRSLSIPSRSDV